MKRRGNERRLIAILDQMPMGVAWLGPDLHCVFANRPFKKVLAKTSASLADGKLIERLPQSWQAALRQPIRQALNGEEAQVHLTLTEDDGEPRSKKVTVLPQPVVDDESGKPSWDALVLIGDTTEWEHMRRKLLGSVSELADLKAALDAHAIVAVTDARGVITSVNDRFCAISQYDREELIGRTHNVVNSGYHPREFFAMLWQTISSGKVWHGEICNRAKDGSFYWVQTTIVPFLGADGRPGHYIAIRAEITGRKLLEENIQQMALFDELTGLPNRRLMTDRLSHAREQCSRSGHHGALMFLDLDNFKEVNDTLGHESGDALLKRVADRLRASIRKVDTVARAGGDEFVIIITDLDKDAGIATDQACTVAEKLRSALSEPYLIGRATVHSSPSIGLVLFHDKAETKSELLKHADMALYRAKLQGRNQVSVFDMELRAETMARAALIADLRQAVARQQFHLYYQPVVDKTRRVTGQEALIRWEHPGRGTVMPGGFIMLAEQTGLIQEIGSWVLKSACEQLRAWSRDPVSAQWSVSVNVSARQFRDRDFVAAVKQAIDESGVDPRLLRLEMTESMFHAHPDETIEIMTALQSIGVRFSMDDFGTGYSSLSSLKQWPVDELKIDRSFVQDIMNHPQGKVIVQTILDLAHAFGMTVVAEGVESMQQFEFLEQHGCQKFQGYLFGKPAPAKDCIGQL